MWENLGIFGLIVAAITFLLREAFKQLLSRDIERFKASLEQAAFEHQVRFSHLHERRAEVIAELYAKLRELYEAILIFAHLAQMAGESNEKNAERAFQALQQFDKCFYHSARLYLPRSLNARIENLREKAPLRRARWCRLEGR